MLNRSTLAGGATVLALLLSGCGASGTELLDRTRKLAEEGDVAAQFNLALMYHYGTGVEQDLSQAAGWYEKAAAQDHLEAQFYLASAYRDGLGLSADPGVAADWFERAAQREHAAAQYSLGRLYDEGQVDPRGGAPDEMAGKKTAADWYRRAAEQGHPDAQYALGYLHRYGLGVPEDHIEAYFWWELARHRVDLAGFEQKKLAIEIADNGDFTMSRDDVEQAKVQVDRWIEAHPESGLRARPASRRLSTERRLEREQPQDAAAPLSLPEKPPLD